MRMLRPVITCALLVTLVAACNKVTDQPKPTSSVATSNSNQSVALPPSALPPSDAAMKPAPPTDATTITNAATPTQASPKELNKQQQSAVMPLPGQVNNHSTPEPLDKKQ